MLAAVHKALRHTSDRGASAVEYGLMVAAIAAVIVGAVFGLGQVVQTKFIDTTACIENAPSSTDACPETDTAIP